MGEDPADGDRVEEEGEDPHLAAGFLADQWVDLVDTTDELWPLSSGTAPLGGIWPTA